MTVRIYPENLDKSSVLSSAELTLYQAFRDQLPDNFMVFHGVSWLGRRRGDPRPADGEADFVIAHPQSGVLVLEVKGGLVGRDDSGNWYSIRRDGLLISIKDPFEQVKRNKFALIQKLRELPNWPGKLPTVEHAVAFPDGVVDLESIGPAAPAEIIMHHHHLADVTGWVRACMSYWRGEGNFFYPPHDDGMSALKEFLARSWQLRPPRLGEQIGVESTRIKQYTQEQFALLRQMDGQARAAIRGCAGSGKTLLAIQKARQLASEGFRVLLTCYNRRLVDRLRRITGENPRLSVYNFHQLCQLYAARTGYVQDAEWNERLPGFFDHVMPQALLEAAATEEETYRFDAIIIDEGQDFHPGWLDALELLLTDPQEGVFYIFYDDNQLLYARPQGFPVGTVSRTLTVNCRNTQRIHEAIITYYHSDLFLQSHGPVGREIELYRWPEQPENQRALLVNVLATLIHVEKVSNKDIVVLGPQPVERPPFSTLPPIRTFQLVPEVASADTEILCTSVRLFKGLESPIIILVMPDDTGQLDEMMYVGLSRACNHVIVFAGVEPYNRLQHLVTVEGKTVL